jgi:hypothetical protein
MGEIYLNLFVCVLCHCPVSGHAMALLVEALSYEPQSLRVRLGFFIDFNP